MTSDKVTPVQYREKITWSSTRNAEGKESKIRTRKQKLHITWKFPFQTTFQERKSEKNPRNKSEFQLLVLKNGQSSNEVS